MSTYFPTAPLYTEDGMAGTGVLWRYLYMYFSMVGIRCQYYFAWKLSEGAGILAGLGCVFALSFEGRDVHA